MSTYDDELRVLEAEYKAKAEHYRAAGETHLSAVYWGCYTGVFSAGCAYQRHKHTIMKEMDTGL